MSGMSRDEIAVFYGVSLSRVKRWIKEFAIETSSAPKRSHANARAKKEKSRALGHDEGITILEKVRLILGQRVTEDYRGYLLDGRPVRTDVLVRTAGLKFADEV
jgi:hypothetical protein